MWDSFDLDCILQKRDLLFKYLNNYRYLEMKNLPQEFLNNRRGEITVGTYLVYITEIVSDCQQIGSGALLIINNYIIALFLEYHCFYSI